MRKYYKKNRFGNNLVILMCNLPWKWSSDYTNQTALELSKNNFVICYMVTEMFSLKEYIFNKRVPRIIEKKSSNLFIYYPVHFLPFKRFTFIASINNRINVLFVTAWIFALSITRKFNRSLLWVFDPAYLNIYKQFTDRFLLVYDCVDYFPGAKIGQEKYYQKLEDELICRSNFVFVISQTLKNIHSRLRSKICIVPQGFRLQDFEGPRSKLAISLPQGPSVGYVGAMNFRLDYQLLIQLAKEMKYINFVFIGPIQNDYQELFESQLKKLLKIKNVYYLGDRPKKEIPQLADKFTVGMIPYDVNIDFNKYCYPMKLFEYFYLGKPVIATPIVELKKFPEFVFIGRNMQSWKKHIRTILNTPWPLEKKMVQKKLAINNSWSRKVTRVLSEINKHGNQ